MSKLVPLELADGGVIYVEAEGEEGGPIKAGGTDEEKTARRFEKALAYVRPTTEALMKTLQDINTPAEIGLEFGLTFSTDVDAFVVSGKAGTTFKVSLKWKNES